MASRDPGAETDAKSKPLIAVVDDDPSVLRAMDRLIRSHGCGTASYNSGVEFLQSLAADRPDCLILDAQMPGMSGLDVQATLVAQGIRCPVVFITAHDDPQVENLARRQGAVGFLHKPFRNDALWALVAESVSAARQPCRPAQ